MKLASYHIHKIEYIICILCCHLLLCGQLQAAPRVEIPSSPNPVGSGARALGMGGAFIAVADDATSASWNPGGLIQLETPEISVVGACFWRYDDNDVGTNPESSGEQSVSERELNYFSISYPFVLFDRNMIISLNHQYLYDFNRDWNFPLTEVFGGGAFVVNGVYDHQQSGGLYATGLAYCIQMTPTFSFGFTLNFWEDWFGHNGWEHKTSQQSRDPGSPISYIYVIKDKYDFEGFNANLGLMWNVNSKLTIGAVFKTPFTADLKHKNYSMDYVSPFYPAPVTSRANLREELDMPMSYGIGFAYRFSDQLTASADIYRTEWQDFVLKDSTGAKTSPISGLPTSISDVGATHQVRIGAEYLFIKQDYIIPMRGGLFYDPAPSEDGTDDFFGITIGSGIAIKSFVFDIAYQYRFGNDVGEALMPTMDFKQDVDEHTIYSSVIVHF